MKRLGIGLGLLVVAGVCVVAVWASMADAPWERAAAPAARSTIGTPASERAPAPDSPSETDTTVFSKEEVIAAVAPKTTMLCGGSRSNVEWDAVMVDDGRWQVACGCPLPLGFLGSSGVPSPESEQQWPIWSFDEASGEIVSLNPVAGWYVQAQPTATLTPRESAFVEAAATQELERARAATAEAEETKSAQPTSTPRPTRTPRPPPKPHYDLKLVSRSCTIEYGYITVEGFVENVSGRTLESVEAVAIFYDAEGTPISSDSALIDYDPLLPGQSSPYEVLDRHNPAMEGCNVEFKEFWGNNFKTDYSAVQ